MDSDSGWLTFVAVLATMPDVRLKLRLDHSADEAGYCRSCLTPGRGTPLVPFPCSLRSLADAATR